MARTPAHAARRSRRLPRAAAALAAALGAAAVLLAGDEAPVHAATPLTLKTIAIDGDFSDWGAVLANTLQTTHDGDGSSGAIKANCGAFSTDRDCPLSGGAGNDFLTFAWTYDASYVYLYIERYGSTANGVDFLFAADVNRDLRLKTADDVVVHADWNGTTQAVAADLWQYSPNDATNGDPVACTPVAPATRCANAAGVLAAPEGYVDGYKLPGTNVSRNFRACTGCTGQGSADGTRAELRLPWSAFGVAAEQPFYWHTVSSNNASLTSAVDNIGAPNGRVGTFTHRGVALYADASGSIASPGQATYVHTLRNDGNDVDRFELAATSSQGAQVELLLAGSVIATDLTGDGAWDGILAGHDVTGDGRPDVSLAADAAQELSLRVTLPAGRSGTDTTRLTAASAAEPAVSASVTDTSQIGTAAFLPAAQAAVTVAGQPLPFREALRNAQGVADTFELTADAGCAGFRLELAADASGSPGAVMAVDETGDGTWDTVDPAGDTDGDGAPDLGAIPAGGTKPFHLVVTPPAGTTGSACTVALAAAASGTGASASARHDVSVAERVTLGPSFVGTTPGVRDAADAQVAVGGSIFLPVTLVNAESTARAYDLVKNIVPPIVGGGFAVWSDPNGDGSPSDGERIVATPGTVPPFGGVAHLVLEVLATSAPAGSLLRFTVTARALDGGAEVTQATEVVVGYVVAYANPLHTDAASAFAPCTTVYVGARGLLPGDTTRYALQWLQPSGTALATVSPWPTTAIGTADGELALPADAPLGEWSARLLESGARKDDAIFQVSLAGAIPTLATDAARYAAGDAVTVTAGVANGGAAALLGTSLVYSGAVTRALAGVDALPGGTVADAFTFTLPSDAAIGTHTLTLGWQLSCGSSPFISRSVSFDVVPQPPVITAPAAGATLGLPDLVAGQVPFSGTAEPGATVAIRVDGADAGTATAGAGGGWTIAAAVAEGPHEVTARQTVAGVEGNASAPVAFALDTTPPGAPAIGAPESGTSTNAASVAVSGTATDPTAAEVQVLADGVLQATVPVVSGAFEATVSLGEATWDLTARALDAAGNASGDSATVALTVDRTPPAAPSWSAPPPSAATLVAISGTAEEGARVEILDGTAVVATGTATGGTFSLQLTLSEGSHPITVRATDAAGNAADAGPADVVVDLTAPAAPSILAPADAAVLGVDDLAGGLVTISGTAEADATVTVDVDGSFQDPVVADAGGAWSVQVALASGTHVAIARATDAAGNASGPGAATTFALDAVLPAAPVLLSPAAPLATRVAVLSVSGTAEAGATVHLRLDGVVVETVTADANGLFGADVPLPAGDGPAVLTAVAVDGAGNASAPSASVLVTVDRAAPPAATFTAPSPTALAAVPIQGTAEAGATVEVLDGTTVVATTTAGGAGAFSATAALAEGTHVLSVRVRDAAGNATTSGTVTVVVDRTAPPAPAVGAPADGAVLGLDDLVAGEVPLSGTAEPFATIEIEIDGVSAATAVADAQGSWSTTAAPTSGAHVVRARAVDAAGNASGLGTSSGFTLDVALPAAPVLVSPAGALATNAAALSVSGTAEPGATVRLLLAGEVVATCAADGVGAFGADVALPGAEGDVVLTAIAVDAAGNPSTASAEVTVTVDRTAPAAPTFAAPADGAVFAPGAVEVRGQAEPGAAVAVTAAGAPLAATAAGDGAWTVTATFPEGTHAVTATATDAAGNTSPAASITVVARVDGGGGGGGGGGCGCRTGAGSGAPALLGLLALVALSPRGRRRRV